MRTLLEKDLVFVKLDVLEAPDKKNLENAGGEEVMKEVKGAGAGLPFTAILSPDRKLIINSHEKQDSSSNIGYPAAPNEIAHFMAMLKKGAPRLTEAERYRIKRWLEENAPKM